MLAARQVLGGVVARTVVVQPGRNALTDTRVGFLRQQQNPSLDHTHVEQAASDEGGHESFVLLASGGKFRHREVVRFQKAWFRRARGFDGPTDQPVPPPVRQDRGVDMYALGINAIAA